jgi:hypothetical protein
MTTTQRAPSADANIAGSGSKGRRVSHTTPLKGRRGSGVEKTSDHVSGRRRRQRRR